MLPPPADDPVQPLQRGPHLSGERLASLADHESPTAAEALHLDLCRRCRDELGSMAELVAAARRELRQASTPLTDWARLAPALRASGLMAPGSGSGGMRADDLAGSPGAGDVIPIASAVGPRRPVARALTLPAAVRGRSWGLAWRSAAALLLVAGGVAAGRASAGATLIPSRTGAGDAPAARVAAILADSAPAPASGEEAMAVLTRAERDYRMATSYLAASSTPAMGVDRPEVYQRRLAVMDEVASLTRAALAESPHDPVLNQYYLASLGAREATLQSLASALPSGARLSRF